MAPSRPLRVSQTGLADAAGVLRVASWAIWDISRDLTTVATTAVSKEPALTGPLDTCLDAWVEHVEALWRLCDGLSDGVTTSAKSVLGKDTDLAAWIREHLGVDPGTFDPDERREVDQNLREPPT